MLGLFETVIGAVTTHSTKTAISGTLLLIIVGLIIVFYVITAWLLYRIGKRLGYEKCWLAWVPFANIWMMCELSGKSNPQVWFASIILLAIVSYSLRLFISSTSARSLISLAVSVAIIVLYILLWADISERCGKPSWWGIIYFIPLVGWACMYEMGKGEPIPSGIPAGYKFIGYGYPQGYDQHGNPIYPQQPYPPQGYAPPMYPQGYTPPQPATQEQPPQQAPQYPPPFAPNQPAEQSTKKCPFCAEIIEAEAIKCEHCGSMLNVEVSDLKIDDYFSNQLLKYYLEHGQPRPEKIISTLNKSPLDLTDKEKTFCLNIKDSTKRKLEEIFKKSGASKDEWIAHLPSTSHSIIGMLANEMLAGLDVNPKTEA